MKSKAVRHADRIELLVRCLKQTTLKLGEAQTCREDCESDLEGWIWQIEQGEVMLGAEVQIYQHEVDCAKKYEAECEADVSKWESRIVALVRRLEGERDAALNESEKWQDAYQKEVVIAETWKCNHDLACQMERERWEIAAKIMKETK